MSLTFQITGLTLVLAYPAIGFGQPANVQPAEPRAGDRLVLTYDVSAKGARLRSGDDIRVLLWIHQPSGQHRTQSLPLAREGDVRRLEWIPPADAIGVTVHFISLDPERPYDPQATVARVIRDQEGKLPRGAGFLLLARVTSFDQTKAVVDEEMARHPDGWAILREKWFRAEVFLQSEQELGKILNADLARVEAYLRDHPDHVEALYAQTAATARLGRLDEALALLERLIKTHPESHWAGKALSHVDYQIYKLPGGADKQRATERVRQQELELAKANPRDEVIRWQVAGVIAKNAHAPLSLVDEIANAWLQDVPNEPQAHLVKATIRLDRKTELEQAQQCAAQAIEGLVHGKIRLTGDVSGQLQQLLLPFAYQTDAQIALLRGQHGRALASAAAAQSLAPSSTFEPYRLEGECWEALGNVRRSERAFARALQLGDSDAEGALRKLHARRTGAETGFAEHLRTLMGSTASSGDRPKAPAFQVKSLDGTSFDLNSLKGKVAVINFWHLGCAPCIAEIPSLNEMVKRFDGKNVVFLALTFDAPEPLRPFLAKRAFDYVIIPKASAAAAAFGVEVYPVHVVIDQQGRIAFRRTGGSATIGEQIGGVVEALLR